MTPTVSSVMALADAKGRAMVRQATATDDVLQAECDVYATHNALETAIRELAGDGEVVYCVMFDEIDGRECFHHSPAPIPMADNFVLYSRPSAPVPKVPRGLVSDLKLAELTARAHGSSHAEATIRKAIPILEQLPEA